MGNYLRSFFRQNVSEKDNLCQEFSRDSFSDRFCDDLCEDILQYLSLEVKLRLECVSQQFRRTIFQKQYEFRVDYENRNLMKKITIDSFEAVLKKCPNIRSVLIMVSFFRYRNIQDNSWIELIANNCHHLEEIYVNVFSISRPKQILEQVTEKFGARLKYFKCNHFIFTKSLKRLTYIRELYLEVNDYLDFRHLQEYKFETLEKFSACICFENYKELINFFEKNQGIKCTYLRCLNMIDHGEKFGAQLLVKLSKVKTLTHVEFYEYPINNELFDYGLRLMAENCLNLKSIICKVVTTSDNCHQINDLLLPLKRFRQLQRLDLAIKTKGKSLRANTQENKVSMVTGFQHLIHLTLYFKRYSPELSDEILQTLIVGMPKLQRLSMNSMISLSNDTIDCLCQLKRIEILEITVDKKTSVHISEDKLINYCQNIRHFKIFN